MHRTIVGVLFTAGALCAQHCVGPAPAAELRTPDPFVAMFFLGAPCDYQTPCTLPATYTGFALHFDLAVDAPCTLTSLATILWDEGTVAANPDQTGNRTPIAIYTCPQTHVGNELLRPGTAGSPWSLAGSGVLTVGRYPAESPIVLNAPIALAAGQFGLAIEVAPTTTVFHAANINCGALHAIVHSVPALRQDQFLALTNQRVQSRAFESTLLGSFAGNVAFLYQPDPNAAYWLAHGTGCAAASAPPVLTAGGRPTLGATVQLVTDALPTATAGVLLAVSLVELPAGLPLDAYGMPGCALHLASFDWLYVLGVAANGTASVSINIPSTAAAIGISLHAQSAAIAPGFNAAGLAVGNALCLAIR